MADKKTEEMLQEIRCNLKKKDYYEIMGVPKNADDTQIKNAYRKLALRFHPDKNKVEGAKEVFKKVSNAYSTLIDAEKRASYDRYGPEQAVQAQRQQYYSQQRQQYASDDEQFQFIFRQFFGGGAMFYQPQQQQRMNPEEYRQRQQARNTNMKWMVLFLFLLVLLPRLFESKPDYNLSYSSEYNTQRSTSILKTKFYVRPDFVQSFKDHKNKVLEIEREVDYQLLKKVMNMCENSKRYKQSYEQNAAMSIFENSRTYYQKMANAVDMSQCMRLSELQQKHPQYISQLVYSR